MIGRGQVPYAPKGKPQNRPLSAVNTGLMEVQKLDPPYLPDNFGHHKNAGSGHSEPTKSHHPKRLAFC